MQEIIFNVFPWETRAYIFDFGALQNVFVEWADEANVLGNIYDGRVDSISSSLGAAFLDIGAQGKAFLKLSNKTSVILLSLILKFLKFRQATHDQSMFKIYETSAFT